MTFGKIARDISNATLQVLDPGEFPQRALACAVVMDDS
jgi:hypothetical protein